MSDDLLRRLRCISPVAPAKSIFDTMKEAAAEIERLQAQVQSAEPDCLALDGQASEALAEAERLRAALERIARLVPNHPASEIARAALGQKP